MSKKEEIITMEEWENRYYILNQYKFISMIWEKGKTRVMDRLTGDIFDVTGEKVGGKIMLKVKRID